MRISINRLLTSHGRGGLEGDRPSSSLEHQTRAEVQHIASAPTAHRRSRKIPPQYRPRPSEEVWRATGPPAPSTQKKLAEVRISASAPTAHRRSGNSRHSTALAHPKRPGVHPSLPLPTPVISPSFQPKMTDFIVISAEKRRIPGIRQLRLSIRMAARSPAAAAAESSLAPSSSFFSTPRPSRRQRPRSRIASTLPRPIALRNQ